MSARWKVDDWLSAQMKPRRKPMQKEHDIQVRCIQWWQQFIYRIDFKQRFPGIAPLLIAIPNGGRRDARTGAMLKAEGVVPGAADLQLIIPSRGWHGLFIEMKTEKGRQSEYQKMFQENVEFWGYRYEVCHGFDEFRAVIEDYLLGI